MLYPRSALAAVLRRVGVDPRRSLLRNLANAVLIAASRMLIVERVAAGWIMMGIAAALGVDPRTARKWRDRYATEGASGKHPRRSNGLVCHRHAHRAIRSLPILPAWS
jgi:hypothetical protein